jgi:antirestriction protein
MTEPRIYVACLAAYNAGCLHGAWIDADQSATDLWEDISTMLKASPENSTCQWCGGVTLAPGDPTSWDRPCSHPAHLPGHAEEWAIHDYEGFGSLRLGESESIERIAAIAAGISEHGDAFTAWLSYDSTYDPEDRDAFEAMYQGEFDALRKYAEQYAEDIGMYDAAEKTGFTHVTVDIDMLERDLDIELYTVESDHHTVYVFDPAAA